MAQKTCPQCSEKVGPRLKVCGCGHSFEGKSQKNPKPRQANVSEPRVNQFSSTGRLFSNVVVPAGECPKPLPKEPTLESLSEWIEDIREPFDGRNQILLPSAIYYFARTFFVDIRSKELKRIESLLDQILIPAEEKGVLE